jgi:hypothetical protein
MRGDELSLLLALFFVAARLVTVLLLVVRLARIRLRLLAARLGLWCGLRWRRR